MLTVTLTKMEVGKSSVIVQLLALTGLSLVAAKATNQWKLNFEVLKGNPKDWSEETEGRVWKTLITIGYLLYEKAKPLQVAIAGLLVFGLTTLTWKEVVGVILVYNLYKVNKKIGVILAAWCAYALAYPLWSYQQTVKR